MGVDVHTTPLLCTTTQANNMRRLNGSVRIASMNEAGQTFVDDVQEGDVWFFPPGIPHSIQAFENGCEFLLIFNDGSFSEENSKELPHISQDV